MRIEPISIAAGHGADTRSLPAADHRICRASEAINRVSVDTVASRLDLRFASGSERLTAGDAGRLHQLVASGALRRVDRVTLTVSGPPRLAEARAATVRSELLRYGIVPTPLQEAAIGPDRAALGITRALVTLPRCPNWSAEPNSDFTNARSSNFGCADATNLGHMVANPADLASGRPLGDADAATAVSAVTRYYQDNDSIARRRNARPDSGAQFGAAARHRRPWRAHTGELGMSAVALAKEKISGAAKKEREGIIAIVQDQATLERVQAIIRELQLDDELVFEPTLDGALRRVHDGMHPRVFLIDLGESPAPIAEISAARAVGGPELKLVALAPSTTSMLFRDLLAGRAPAIIWSSRSSREALAAALEKRGAGGGGRCWRARPGHRVHRQPRRHRRDDRACRLRLDARRAAQGAHRACSISTCISARWRSTSTPIPAAASSEALEQPSRIDSLFIDRAMVKVSDTLRILAAEAPVAEALSVDSGAIDVLLYELRRKYAWVVVDLPRWVTPHQRVVLSAASRVVLLCERSLAGLRDAIRLQTLVREHAPQTRLLLVEGGACGRADNGRQIRIREGDRQVARRSIPYDVKAATVAANTGQPLPVAAPRSSVTREMEKLVETLAGPVDAKKRSLFGFSW